MPQPRHPHRVAVFVDLLSGYGRDMLTGIANYVRAHGPWQLYGDPERVAAPIRLLEQWRGDGIIAHLAVAHLDLAKTVRRAGVPAVNVSAFHAGLKLPTVVSDNLAIGHMAADYFRQRGYQHFGFCGFLNHHYSDLRLQGFQQHLRAHQYDCSVCVTPPPQDGFECWRDRVAEMTRWISSLPVPCAIFCCNDDRARHIAGACQAIDRRVPEETAILGVDNDELICDLSDPPLSSIEVGADRIGYAAAQLLDHLIAGGAAPPEPILIPPLGVVTRRSSDVLAISDPKVAAAVRFIRQQVAQPFQVGAVVRHVATSRRVLERRFRQYLQRTIGEEIDLARIDRAKELLIHTDLPMGEIGPRCGFTHIQQFNAVFKRTTGLTPVYFRRSVRNR